MPLSTNSETRQLEVVQCRETTADAALKWAFFGMLLVAAVGLFIGAAAPAYWDWKWRRKAKSEGVRR